MEELENLRQNGVQGGGSGPAESRVAELETQLSDLQATYQKKMEDKAETTVQVRKLKAQFANQKADLMAQLEAQPDDAALRLQIQQLDDQFEASKKAAAAQLMAESTQKDARFATDENDASVIMQKKIIALEQDLGKAERECESTKMETAAAVHLLEEKVRSLTSELKSAHETLQEDKAELEQEVEALRKQNEKERQEKATAFASQQSAAMDLEKRKADLEYLQAKCEKLEVQIPELQAYKHQVDREIEEIRIQGERAQRAMQSKEDKLTEQQSLIDRQKEMLAAKKMKEIKLDRDVATAKAELERLRQTARDDLEDATARLTRNFNDRMKDVIEEHSEDLRRQRDKHVGEKRKLLKRLEKISAREQRALQLRDEELVKMDDMAKMMEDMKVEMLRIQRGVSDESRNIDRSRDEVSRVIRDAKNARAHRAANPGPRSILSEEEGGYTPRQDAYGRSGGAPPPPPTRFPPQGLSPRQNFSSGDGWSPTAPPGPPGARPPSGVSGRPFPRGPPMGNPFSNGHAAPPIGNRFSEEVPIPHEDDSYAF
eukprot:NODE_588_length_1946_cov_16.924618_g471_i0.p1 GENE.NODE_588_length_1946_cov_16.924618_g471_i0~~NODE_588_length_1946_cov_16.924618_g471_i0.p1  ORF type:complete len:614 (-),score=230.05 NODE_588_length_1946_cov_16.924618_g471_i0:105-1736(-)